MHCFFLRRVDGSGCAGASSGGGVGVVVLLLVSGGDGGGVGVGGGVDSNRKLFNKLIKGRKHLLYLSIYQS